MSYLNVLLTPLYDIHPCVCKISVFYWNFTSLNHLYDYIVELVNSTQTETKQKAIVINA